MRILVVSNIYPPFAVGGYEIGCAAVAEHLAAHHDVLVLSSVPGRARSGAVKDLTKPDPTTSSDAREPVEVLRANVSEPVEIRRADASDPVEVRRELLLLSPDARGALRAPLASLRAAAIARRALEWKPDLIYVWNGSEIPQAALRVLADSGVPLAFRVEEQWFRSLFLADQFLRELLPTRRGAARSMWAAGCRVLNALPALRLDPTAPLRAAISWNSEATRRMAQPPPYVEPVLERVSHPAPPYGDVYAAVERQPTSTPEIVFLGRVTPYKGIAVAIEALALLRSEHGLQADLAIVGPEEGEHGEDMRRLADRLGVAEAVRWRGQASPEQAAAALAHAHALIVPSTWEEPFGLVMIEGALARVPLVASDVGGIGEGMRKEEHALLFPRGDAAAAAAALARTLRERESTAARVARAYERAQSFRLGPYLQEQERFVLDAVAASRDATA
jgi:glycosyltransferase involved in cell wall biosynthesis